MVHGIRRIGCKATGISRLSILPVLCLFIFNLAGCAGFSIPAPDEPLKAQPEPPIEDSTITLPITISLEGILHDLGLSSSDSGQDEGTNRKSALAAGLRRFLRRQALKKDNMLVQNMYMRDQAGRAWSALQNPIRLKNDLSLLLNPDTISVSPLTEEDDNIRFVIGLSAKPRLVAGTVQPAKPRPLPALSVLSSPPEPEFHLALLTEIGYDFLGNELTGRFKDRAYTHGGQTITVEKVKLYASGESLVIALRVSGSANGTVYLTGIPAYDPSTRSLAVRNLQYTLETKNVLAKAADWLLHTQLEENIAKRAVWPMGDRIDAARDVLSNGLNRSLNSRMSVSGKIDALRPVSVSMTGTGIKAVLEADGTIEMRISN